MSADDQLSTATADKATNGIIEQDRSEKILKAKDLYSQGSRNFLIKNYAEAADELSQVCGMFEELHGSFSDELGMPYLLYAKSLIALALEEQKVIDVPDEEADDDDDDEDEEEVEENEAGNNAAEAETNGEAAAAAPSTTNGAAAKLNPIKETVSEKNSNEADSTEKLPAEKIPEEAQVSSTEDGGGAKSSQNGAKSSENGKIVAISDGEKPSTSNGDVKCAAADPEEEEENETASTLQLAWEILELAAKIFSRQGMSGLPNLAEVQTELANIEFENNILDAARDDYEKALKIYAELPTNYRRAMAEIHYKIGLTYLMDQLNQEGAKSLKEACALIEAEIEEIKAKPDATEKDKNTIQDLEETKEEIWAKITEIDENQAQKIQDIRAALDNYIKPVAKQNDSDAGPSSSVQSGQSSSSAISSSSSKPTDISHLIKRKKPEDPTSEAEAAASPVKRAAI